MNNKKPDRDHDPVWIICIFIAVLCFWAAYLASDPQGRWHTAFTIWGGFWIGVAVIAVIIDTILSYRNDR